MRALAVLGLVVLVLAPAPASAVDAYPMTFPVQGPNSYTDTFGAPRSGGRSHAGTDILADKMTPVVAAGAGTVGWMHDEQGGNCCAMALNHDDGWASWYIHLNNDTPGTDDGLGWGFAEGIESGVHVEEGQLIGWVGDSGNAEWSTSHLHFELHRPDGTPINPYPHLQQATTAALLPRWAGTDRYATAAEIARVNFEPGVDRVYIASGLDFADALAGAPVAGTEGAPVLLVSATAVPGPIQAELRRLEAAEIVILGGSAVVSPAVEEALQDFTSGPVTRLDGSDRYSTAVRISRVGFSPGVAVAFVANGSTFPDALAGAATAGTIDAPMLLTAATSLPNATRVELQRLAPERIVVLGGTGAVSAQVEEELRSLATSGRVERLSGANRYATAVAISRSYYAEGAGVVYVATGTAFADALAGAPVAARSGGPILLVQPQAVPVETGREIERLAPDRIVILGGTGVVSSTVEIELWDLLNR